MVRITEEDLDALRAAAATLEHPSLAARLGNIAGKPIELMGRATIPALRPRRKRTLRRLAIPAAAATIPNAAVDHGRRSRIYRSCLPR
jgi:hypothetical protein